MRTASFGPTQSQVPVIGQGTWMMERDAQASVDALRAGIDAGATHIDTAEMYGSGACEEIVGRAIAGRRDEVFLVSKVLPQNASRRGVVRACEASLGRLGVDRLDVYLLHWRGGHALEETFAGFDDLVTAGKIAAFGVSNFDKGDLQEALAVAGAGRIACNQVLYHPAERYVERELAPFCREHGVALVAYSPFGSGDFPSAASPAGLALARVAADYDASPRQVALAFLTRGDGTFAVPKSARSDHARDNARAGELVLAAEAIAELEASLPVSDARGLPVI